MQVLGHGEGDFYRTRLTHSLEAAQIGKGIVRQLLRTLERGSVESRSLPELELIETICLAHDLGHPPFGHAGERALHSRMQEHGGFEGNGQTLRLVSRIEELIPDYGLNLTRRSLLGVLKYPKCYSSFLGEDATDSKHPPKCFLDSEREVVTWALEPFSEEDRAEFESTNSSGKAKHKTLDASIMELADDIAYGVHDLEDAVALRLVGKKELCDFLTRNGVMRDRAWVKELFDPTPGKRKRAVGGLVNRFVTNITIQSISGFHSPLLKHRAIMRADDAQLLRCLKAFIFDRVVKRPEVRSLEIRGESLLVKLFDSFSEHPEVMAERWFQRFQAENSVSGKRRVICDFIAGMTDEYATRYYERLFVPRRGSIFERL